MRGRVGNIRERRCLRRAVELEAAHEIMEQLTQSLLGHPDCLDRFPSERGPALQRSQTYREHCIMDGTAESAPVSYVQEDENIRTRKQIPQRQGQSSWELRN